MQSNTKAKLLVIEAVAFVLVAIIAGLIAGAGLFGSSKHDAQPRLAKTGKFDSPQAAQRALSFELPYPRTLGEWQFVSAQVDTLSALPAKDALKVSETSPLRTGVLTYEEARSASRVVVTSYLKFGVSAETSPEQPDASSQATTIDGHPAVIQETAGMPPADSTPGAPRQLRTFVVRWQIGDVTVGATAFNIRSDDALDLDSVMRLVQSVR